MNPILCVDYGSTGEAHSDTHILAPHQFSHVILFSKIYYDLGKQNTNFAIQHSHKEGEETIWTKRKLFLDLDPHKDDWIISHANHRQILKNEIIFDFDRTISKENILNDKDIQHLIQKLREDKWRFCLYHSGSKGVHIHIYYNGLTLLESKERETIRSGLLKNYSWFSDVDLQKSSDKTMIALEHTPHWKTGNTKTLMHNNGVDAWS